MPKSPYQNQDTIKSESLGFRTTASRAKWLKTKATESGNMSCYLNHLINQEMNKNKN